MYNPQLETFLRVADAGSFNKAAELSYITPTAVLKQINLLEADLDVKLFERTHRGLRLTKAGISLYNDTKYIIQYCRDSVIRAKNAMQEDNNVIRIGTSPMTPAQILVELWPKIHVNVVAGIFDETMLNLRHCAGFELSRQPLCCAVSIHHPLAAQNCLELQDLYGENLMLMRRGWSHYVDRLRDDIWEHHNQIQIIDFDFYSVEMFNRCENSNDILLAVQAWDNVHPLLKVIPVAWEHAIPYGQLHSPVPSAAVQRFLSAIQKVLCQ